MKWLGQAIVKVYPELKNAKIADEVKGEGQMSPTFKHF